jgi:hypothetical protein
LNNFPCSHSEILSLAAVIDDENPWWIGNTFEQASCLSVTLSHEASVLVKVMTVRYERLVFGVEELTKGLLTLAFCVASAAIESCEER